MADKFKDGDIAIDVWMDNVDEALTHQHVTNNETWIEQKSLRKTLQLLERRIECLESKLNM